MGLSHHEGIAKRECALHSRDPFQQLSVLSWHGKHLRWSTAIQLSCQSWWELQHNTSPGLRSRDREAVLQLDFPHCRPYTFHLFFLCTSGFPIPAPVVKQSWARATCNIRLKAEARKPSLGSGFMTSLKLVHQGGLQTFGEKRLSGFLVVTGCPK